MIFLTCSEVTMLPRDGINGIPLMPSRGSIVTSEQVRKIMDEEGI